jgi:hypothetical protein
VDVGVRHFLALRCLLSALGFRDVTSPSTACTPAVSVLALRWRAIGGSATS